MNTIRSGGKILVDALAINGVKNIYGVPGESYLEVLDALYDHAPDMQYITCRQEGGAAFMAAAEGAMTGEPSICFVTRGPGATNASIGIHSAFQHSTPMIVFVGQVSRGHIEREAFQELDYRRVFGQMAKWVAQIDDPARIPEYVNRAFQVAMAGRPGPVVLALPEDMLREETLVVDLAAYDRQEPFADPDKLEQLHILLKQATKPFVLVGGSPWTAEGNKALHEFVSKWDLPVGVVFRRQDVFDNHHSSYCGDHSWGPIPSLRKLTDDADLIIALGTRLNYGTTSKYEHMVPPVLKQKLIHIYPDGAELGRVYKADLPIQAGVNAISKALAKLEPPQKSTWAKWRLEGRSGFEKSLNPGKQTGNLDMAEVMRFLRNRLPKDTIVSAGAGNFSDWPARNYTYGGLGTNLAPISGAMGYAVPAAVMASINFPDKLVVGFSGDGDFLMNGQELATAKHYGAKPIILVINNGLYGTIRVHQQRHHPGRSVGTELTNPDFSAYAKAFGGHGETVVRTEDFPAAFERAVTSGLPSIIELQIDSDAIGINLRLSEI
jgi:acetolactate synthase-1/2/3 large subunit